MKTRSSFELCLPAALLAVACALSVPACVFALVWMGIGVACLGHRDLRDFPRERIELRWLFGVRAVLLWCFHLAWWPWYVRGDIAAALVTTRRRRRLSGDEE
jgi:hypothetical protein